MEVFDVNKTTVKIEQYEPLNKLHNYFSKKISARQERN